MPSRCARYAMRAVVVVRACVGGRLGQRATAALVARSASSSLEFPVIVSPGRRCPDRLANTNAATPANTTMPPTIGDDASCGATVAVLGERRPVRRRQRSDDDRGARGVVVVQACGRCRRRCCRRRARPRGRRANAAGSRARPRARSGRSCSLVQFRLACSCDEHFVFRASPRGAARGSSAAARRTSPAAAEHQRDDREAPRDERRCRRRRVQQDVARRRRSTYASTISLSVWPASIRSRMSSRIARASGTLLSATDSPAQTGHASSRSSRCARASSRVGRLRPDHEHDERRRDDDRERQPGHAARRIRAGPAPARNISSRLSTVTAAELLPRHPAVGPDHEGLGLARGPEPERSLALRVERDRPPDILGRDVVARPFCLSSSRTMPIIAKSGSSLWRS